jgi:serine/threonine-protein kinase
VALKILPEQFASDSQRMGRFQREAEVLASLDHPNIGQIYGIEDAGQTKALVLQLIEGPTLADKIAQGPIPVEEALKIALQMAEGLEAAHEKGVIHRDLKPANIKITPEGVVKILDFGLAKALEGEAPPDSSLSQSPTLTNAATQAGVILGTAGYMSPEQARGEATDKKADVWAFGCVLFEMLTRQATFGGKTVSDVLAGVLRIDPEWKSLPPNLHPQIRLLLERSLEKESKDRYHDIADARLDIQKALADPSGVLVQPTGDVAQARPQSKLPWVAALILAVITGVAVWNLKPVEPRPVAARFYHKLPDDQAFSRTDRSLVAISPDGSKIVYVANQQLYLRNLGELEAHPIRGTDEDPSSPFFSPDGQWVGYLSDQQLKKIATIGGAPVIVCDATNPSGASWGADDTIVFVQMRGIWRVSANGGTAELVIETQGVEQVSGPQILPSGTSILFTLSPTVGANRWDQAQIVVQSLESGDRKVLLEGGSAAQYVPTGHLVYASEDVLLAVAFNLAHLEVQGGPVSVVEGVQRAFQIGYSISSSTSNYGFSKDGALVYVPGTGTGSGRTLVWVDRAGKVEPLALPPRAYEAPRLSPDSQSVMATIDGDAWIYDIATGRETRVTRDGLTSSTIWSPDGSSVAYTSARSGMGNIFVHSLDASGKSQQITIDDTVINRVNSWSPDGQVISFHQLVDGTRNIDVLMVPLKESGQEIVRLLQDEFAEEAGVFSPGGNWIAYNSNETGQGQIYVTPYAGSGVKHPISTGGGTGAVWARNGELFYRTPDGDIMVVNISTEPTLEIGTPEVVFAGGQYEFGPTGPRANYDVTPDGRRFLMVAGGSLTEADEVPSSQINIILNWFEELKERVPVP